MKSVDYRAQMAVEGGATKAAIKSAMQLLLVDLARELEKQRPGEASAFLRRIAGQ